MKLLHNCWFEEDGQDLTEYALILAFVALASAAIFMAAGGSIVGIWQQGNVALTRANLMAAS
jgi:Flp pilus assembly pilin Flp